MSAHHGKGSVIKLKLGLRARSEAEWLPSDDIFGNELTRAEQVALKDRLLAKHHQDVFSAMPNTNDGRR